MNWNHFEELAFMKGFRMIAGLDEAGRGALAGPVVAAACIIPRGIEIKGINDSKKLTPKQREELYTVITEHPDIIYAVGMIDHQIIDQVNILKATHLAMIKAVEELETTPDYLLIDGNQMPTTQIALQGIVKGDSRSQSIAAASIIAKETRDRWMIENDCWPDYGFSSHKGYATPWHLKIISEKGPCPIHRLSYAPFQPDLFL